MFIVILWLLSCYTISKTEPVYTLFYRFSHLYCIPFENYMLLNQKTFFCNFVSISIISDHPVQCMYVDVEKKQTFYNKTMSFFFSCFFWVTKSILRQDYTCILQKEIRFLNPKIIY